MTQSELTQEYSDSKPPMSVNFLVVPGCSLLTLASTVEPLRAANRQAGSTVFDWRFVSVDGTSPITSSGIAWPVSGKHDPSSRCDVLAIIAGFGAPQMTDRKLIAHIYRAARNARLVIGIESGAWLLARAGLLDEHRAATHWEDFEEFAAAFPNVDLRPDRYVIDRRFVTTSGASPTLDMMVDLVGRELGHPAALEVATSFVHDYLRAAGDAQVNATLGDARHDPRLVRSIRIMETHVDAPVSIAAIAKRVSMSARGLEQLFSRQMGQTPGAYFLSLRLAAARRLVSDTRLSMTDIASRTGFSSESAFSRAFSRQFDLSPSASRKRPASA
ncbi:transcriptional regulator containing an amidase domain and an AraC-type DNA-binding HTH domain [Hoeflea sp. IMCC20628]|uniref:GlxA family transcriptional regulator n=1 Tax=Hoeflea sp. IMCC20628 TaxID=1620421 RepID=UPI00063ADB47|nr:GlxA family transcriptional regulator [Hoeflea sp. IMCC20628]AKI01649.1 transcriptional regulator containing an amidase domain and an AraC-type DNA-binding HTH domain [Hoeflea sp. IMCC20628]